MSAFLACLRPPRDVWPSTNLSGGLSFKKTNVDEPSLLIVFFGTTRFLESRHKGSPVPTLPSFVRMPTWRSCLPTEPGTQHVRSPRIPETCERQWLLSVESAIHFFWLAGQRGFVIAQAMICWGHEKTEAGVMTSEGRLGRSWHILLAVWRH